MARRQLIQEFVEANERFHTLIYSGAHNTVIAEATAALRRRLALDDELDNALTEFFNEMFYKGQTAADGTKVLASLLFFLPHFSPLSRAAALFSDPSLSLLFSLHLSLSLSLSFYVSLCSSLSF